MSKRAGRRNKANINKDGIDRMSQKLYDLVVKTGEYTNGSGETKGRYENVGSMMQGDNGPFLIMKRTFNPAGVANPDNKDSVIVSCFQPQDQQQAAPQQAPQQAPMQQPAYGQQQQAPQQPYQQEPYRG